MGSREVPCRRSRILEAQLRQQGLYTDVANEVLGCTLLSSVASHASRSRDLSCGRGSGMRVASGLGASVRRATCLCLPTVTI